MRIGPVIALAVIAGLGYAGWRWIEAQPEGRFAGMRRGGGPGMGPPPGMGGGAAVPVTVVPVKVADVPVRREGIGNIQARKAVTVRAQIDGPLLSVAFAEGQSVRKGDVLARIDPGVYQAQFDQAVAKKAQDEAQLANARIDLERYQRLARSEAGSRQQADQQAAQVAQLEALVKADEAQIASARTTLGYTTIYAPVDGRAGLRQIDPGNIIRGSDANGLVTIMQVKPIDAVFTLPQRDLEAARAALQRGKATAEIAPTGGGAAIATGELEAIDNAIDQATGTIRLKATFPNEDERLWPGQFVNVRLVVDVLKQARIVPSESVRRGPQGVFVYVVTAGDTVETRTVEVIEQDARQAVIAKGLEAGERVVTLGFQRLRPGSRVTIAPESGVAAPVAGPPAGQERRRRPQGAQGAAPGGPSGGPPGGAEGEGRRRRGPPPGAGAPAEGAAAPAPVAPAPAGPAPASP